MVERSHPLQAGPFRVERSYEPYSDDPDYLEGNRGFIRDLDLACAGRVLDLACGIGTLSRIALADHPDLDVVGLDLSLEGLQLARRRYTQEASLRSPVSLVHASADAIPLAGGSFDAVLMGHSIHMLPDADALIAEVRRVLRPGGLFAFNTSFYAGTFVPGTESFYHDWVKEALCYIRRKDRQLRSRGGAGIRRRRGRAPPAFSSPWTSPSEWAERLERSGFRVPKLSERTVPLTRYSFEAIGAYVGFAEVMLSGYPVEHSCGALQAAAGPTFTAAGVASVPRNWLEIAALKR